jgi:aminoglycoside phosphotransferase (APT) family kinase protein
MCPGLAPAALERVRQVLAPGGHVVRVRPMRGGISSSVHLVSLRTADGARQAVVVRRYGEYWRRVDPSACEREFRLLTALAETSFPVPRPLLLEAGGGPFGAPTVVMTRLPGRPLCAPRDLDNYLKQMAATLAELHSLPTDGLDFLPNQRTLIDRSLGKAIATDDPLQQAVGAAVRAAWARMPESGDARVLCHGDYWPGNLLWVRGRLVGVVDWEQPRLGDPEKDVATCRGDLAVLFGLQAADQFTACYEAVSDRGVTNLRFWDLLISISAVAEMPVWAPSYRALGRLDLTTEVATARIRRFAQAALEHA